ncbi:MAG: saccharopine dehydrogenase NADP-binding domain-containing protein [Planctomycetota bacterium]
MAEHPVVFIAGAGGIGRALALLLRSEPSTRAAVVLGDLSRRAVDDACAFADVDVSTGAPSPRGIEMPARGVSAELTEALAGADAILDCLPGAEAPRMARLAREHGCHYLNLTEYVAETDEVIGIAEGAETCFALQCGLAPGFINVLGHDLFLEATRAWGVDRVDSLEMRVGALTRHATAPHFYGWTWSPVGVATEYVEDALAVRGGETVKLPSLTERRTLLLSGSVFEEALTSGGAADLPAALGGRVQHLDYKTLRHPGHYEWVEGLLAGIPAGEDRAAKLQDAMEAVIPHIADDLVVVHASVEGRDEHGVLRAMRATRFCSSIDVAGRRLRAIQSTTAAGIAEVLRIVLEGGQRGALLQSQVPTASFLGGPFVALAYGEEERG